MFDLDKKAFLFYGTDFGQIQEYVHKIRQNWLKNNDKYLEITNTELNKQPNILLEESLTLSLFAANKLILVCEPNAISIKTIQQWLQQYQGCKTKLIIIYQGTIPSSTRISWEKQKQCQITKCYPYTKIKQKEKITSILQKMKQPITLEALDVLNTVLGNDYQITKNEIDKLISYHGNQNSPIQLEEVKICIIDSQMITIDQVIDQHFIGKILSHPLLHEYQPFTIIHILLQHLGKLHWIHSQKLVTGLNIKEQILLLQPPLHFSRYNIVLQQLQLWPLIKIHQALSKLSKIESLIKKHNTFSNELYQIALAYITNMSQVS